MIAVDPNVLWPLINQAMTAQAEYSRLSNTPKDFRWGDHHTDTANAARRNIETQLSLETYLKSCPEVP